MMTKFTSRQKEKIGGLPHWGNWIALDRRVDPLKRLKWMNNGVSENNNPIRS
jgi:hypothetical protein